MATRELTATNFDETVTGSDIVLVDFWAEWCGPCRAIAPVVEQLAAENAGRLKVVKVNADDSPQVSARHGITGIPTLLFYAGGTEASRSVGALPAPQLRSWVQSSLQGAAAAS